MMVAPSHTKFESKQSHLKTPKGLSDQHSLDMFLFTLVKFVT